MKVVIGVVGLFWSVGLVTGFAFDLYGDKQECFTQELHASMLVDSFRLFYALIFVGLSGSSDLFLVSSGV